MAENTNPGNFSNRPQEEVSSIAQKGGQSSHEGGFASMDPDKQVRVARRKKYSTCEGLIAIAERDRFQGRQSFRRVVRAGQ
jgi:hypothetical protein